VPIGIIAAILAVRVLPEDTPDAALLDVSLFRMASYTTAQVTVFFTGLSLFGGLILLPLYYEELLGLTVIKTGLLMLAYGIGAMAGLPISGRLTDSIGSGISCIIGLAMASMPAMTAAMRAAPGHLAVATANIMQRVGGSLGSAFIVIVIARTTPQPAAFQAAYAILAATAAIALIASASLAISERWHRAAVSEAAASQQVHTSPS